MPIATATHERSRPTRVEREAGTLKLCAQVVLVRLFLAHRDSHADLQRALWIGGFYSTRGLSAPLKFYLSVSRSFRRCAAKDEFRTTFKLKTYSE